MILTAIVAQVVIPPAPSPEPGTLLRAQVLQRWDVDSKPHRQFAELPIFQQRVEPAGDMILALSGAEAKAFKARTGIGVIGSWEVAEWLLQPRNPYAPLVHRGFLFCDRDGKRYRLCLRDADDDGRVEAKGEVVPGGIIFTPIDPVPYNIFRLLGRTQYFGVTITYDHRADGQLDFYASIAGNAEARISRPVIVDPAQLPSRVELLGAQLTVHAWDGKKPTVSVDRGMTSGAIRLVEAPIPGRSGKSLRVEMVDGSLPKMVVRAIDRR